MTKESLSQKATNQSAVLRVLFVPVQAIFLTEHSRRYYWVTRLKVNM